MPHFQTVVEALQHWAQKKPDSAAFIFRDKNQQRGVMTWASVYTLSGRFAAALRDKGLARGCLVINTLPNSPERVVCETGIWMSGAASINGQCVLADGSDLINTINLSHASAILVDPDIMDSPWNVLKNHVTLGQNGTLMSSSLPYLKNVFFVRRMENAGEGDFIGQLKSSENWFQADDLTPDDNITVFTTSGSTGFTKLVMYTHEKLIGSMQRILDKVTIHPTVFNLSPQGWIGNNLCLYYVPGITNITCDFRAGIPEDIATFIFNITQQEKYGTASLPPSCIPSLAKIVKNNEQKRESDPNISPAWKLSLILLGGQPITQNIVKAALKLADSVAISYGSTEIENVSLLHVTVYQSYVDHDSGKPISAIDVKVTHPDNEELILPTNQIGHILVKGPFMLECYLNDPKATADAFTKDGFFRTGDFGRLDERGHLIVDGRGNDAITRGPCIFYPTWIEKRLHDCPGVKNAIVVGVPDPFLHEELCACLELESSDVSIQQVRQFMEEYVVVSDDNPLSPRPRHYLQFESFPQTNSLKLKRKDIKIMAAQRLGLS